MPHRQYDITLESPMGPKQGTLRMEVQNGTVTGILSLLGYDNRISGTVCGAGELCLSHLLRSAVSIFQCRSELKLTEKELSGRVCTQHGCWDCHGTLTTETKKEQQA